MRYPAIIIFFFFHLTAPAQGFLKARGPDIVDGSGKEVILRGMGLGGWMLQEPYMLKLSGAAIAQYDIRKKITGLIGKENTKKFYDAWLSNHCTKADIDSLAAWGFNSVRLPMHYNLFTLPAEEEPVKGNQTWLSKGFQLTDSLLSWCRSNRIYLVLDLHAAPGGQGNDNAISDRDASKPSLWQSEANKAKTIALWQKLATRYVHEEWIGGYDLINEPNWGFQNAADKNGCAETRNEPLKKLLKDITAAIRKVDKQHIIFIEGNCWANNYEGIFPLWDDNMVISFHKYWNYTNKASIQKFIDYREKYQVPVWMGETGENSNAWFTDVVSLLEKNKIGWNMWPLKKSGLNNPLQVKVNPGAQKIIDHWHGKAGKPSAADAFKALMQWAADTRISNNIVHRDVADAMMRQVNATEAIPFKKNIIETHTILFAADYDIGRAGIAYHDKDSAEYWVSTNVRTPWNIGSQYRNDGVDIEQCSDAVSNGYNVGWIETGEWMQYSIYTDADALFDINIRYASKDSTGQLRLLLNDQFASENNLLPQTGGTQNWKTNSIKKVRLTKGWNRLRVLATGGGFNLNYLEFIGTGNTAMNK
ncbi:MAG TPA: cellulase family glycosylhydrolase [Ferruginibacter sp.]|nr:cellulase family glycosylhydrolase [Ferruginibacter sp.]